MKRFLNYFGGSKSDQFEANLIKVCDQVKDIMENNKQDKATQISNLVKRRDELETKIKDLNDTSEKLYVSLFWDRKTILINDFDRLMLVEKAMNDLKKVHEEIGGLL